MQPARRLNMPWGRVLRTGRAEIADRIGNQTCQTRRHQDIFFITPTHHTAHGHRFKPVFFGNKTWTQAWQAQFVGDSTWNTAKRQRVKSTAIDTPVKLGLCFTGNGLVKSQIHATSLWHGITDHLQGSGFTCARIGNHLKGFTQTCVINGSRLLIGRGRFF